MKKIAYVLLLLMLAGCGGNEAAQGNGSQNPGTSTKASGVPYSAFNKVTLEDFLEDFESKYYVIHEKMDEGQNVPKAVIGEYEVEFGTTDIWFSPHLVLSAVLNDDDTLSMVVLTQLMPTKEPADYNEIEAKKVILAQYSILEQALIASTAPGATKKDLKTVQEGLAQKSEIIEEEADFFIHKEIAYSYQLDKNDPAGEKKFFFITFEGEPPN
ncbi:hypothetical protein [Neobacillus sp. YIM B06451]|uniref:hypothetical protein n=1 Tax=Neobacillus sp. YIM B06451 TaxID=3070994 RepID=UPI0029315894|nr:hypothetical protein [Neobacillus sp. YIM B06451]